MKTTEFRITMEERLSQKCKISVFLWKECKEEANLTSVGRSYIFSLLLSVGNKTTGTKKGTVDSL